MLRIRSGQLRLWPAFSERLLERRIAGHLGRHHAAAVAHLDDAEMRRRVGLAIREARSHGMTSPRGIGLFAALMFEFGPEFHAAPEVAAALRGPLPERQLAELIEAAPAALWDALPGSRWPSAEAV